MLKLVFFSALVAFCDLAVAGPKRPRSPGHFPRQYSTNSSSWNTSSAVALNILTKTGVRNETAPYLYGWMFEDINHSGDGGIYGELLTNRAFDGSDITWGSIPDISGSSIVYQENPCLAYGKYINLKEKIAHTSRPCSHRLQTNWQYLNPS
jgi:alpha-N-arabinofuranosidase